MTCFRSPFALLLLTVGVLGCEPAPDPPTPSPPDTVATETAPAPATDSVMVSGITLPALLDQVYERDAAGQLTVLDAMRPPLRAEHAPVQNRHDASQTDTVHTLVYGGLRIEVYDVADSGREIIRAIEVTGDDYRTPQGLAVGSPRADVVRALGDPVRVVGDTLVYERYNSEHDPTPTLLRIALEGNRVAAMTWNFYID